MIATQKKQLGVIDPVTATIIITSAVKLINKIAGDKCKRNCDFTFLFNLSKRRKCKCQCVANNPGTLMPPKETVESCAARGVDIFPVTVIDDPQIGTLQPGTIPQTQKAAVNPILPLAAIGAGLTFFA